MPRSRENNNQEKHQSRETDPEMTEMMELADKNNKTAIITIFWVFKRKYEQNEETNRKYKNHIKPLEVKNTISEMKNGSWYPPEKVIRGEK